MFIKVAKALCLLPWQCLWGSFCFKMCLHSGSAASERGSTCVSLMSELQVTDRVE